MTTAYQGTIGVTFVAPTTGVAGSGCQQAAGEGVIGSDAAVTATLPYQAIGSAAAPVAGAFTLWDGTIP